MDAPAKTRRVHRDQSNPPPQPPPASGPQTGADPGRPRAPRGAKQIVLTMTRSQYDQLWADPQRLRAFIDQQARQSPELFPTGFQRGYSLHGCGRLSRKLPGCGCASSCWPIGRPTGCAPASSSAT